MKYYLELYDAEGGEFLPSPESNDTNFDSGSLEDAKREAQSLAYDLADYYKVMVISSGAVNRAVAAYWGRKET